MEQFTHFNKNGEAIMVDVSQKEITHREAIATGKIKLNSKIIDQIKNGTNKKGDVLAIARIAGIMATKKTSELIPLCHPIFITKVTIDFEIDYGNSEIVTIATVSTDSKTGVEMEALTAVNVSLLTIYDMCKAVDKHMVISDIHLKKKIGGKSGEFNFD